MTLICGMTPEAMIFIRIAGQGRDAFLNTGAAGIVQANNRRALFEGHALNFANLLSVGFRQRAAEDCKILSINKSFTAINRAPACDHAVAGIVFLVHAEIRAAVFDEHVKLFERARIQ